MSKKTFDFAQALLTWFDSHGRKNLPWQKPITPYRVWLSEIMLQQTQVETVIPYFERFLENFPSIDKLASAKQDDVLHLWTGLGYYARARNLHKCAQVVMEQYKGTFPKKLEQLVELPGIGPSTAAAIASIAFKKPTAILDGNVKRVLARFHAIDTWPGDSKTTKILWAHADEHMPKERCADYTQAIMDLGATLCTRSKPQCNICPMHTPCQARIQNRTAELPKRKPAKAKPTKHTQMLIILNTHGSILLEQRPQTGIWGGLWSLPELHTDKDALEHVSQTYGDVLSCRPHKEIKHVFSHYTLKIAPISLQLKQSINIVCEGKQALWYSLEEPQRLGLAAPVKKLLESMAE